MTARWPTWAEGFGPGMNIRSDGDEVLYPAIILDFSTDFDLTPDLATGVVSVTLASGLTVPDFSAADDDDVLQIQGGVPVWGPVPT